ncbi:MAG: CehA/McbA family metallohydrolase [Anaerolineales bacterium]
MLRLHEYSANLHMHTPYSDGEWYHAQIAEAAISAGLDLICVTDHNVWVHGPERYYEHTGKRVLVLVGEEIHDPARLPQKNHLLAYHCQRELARCAPKPQELINAVRECGGLSFLAHPFDNSVPLFDYEDISWMNWEVTGYTGLEIWNYMSNWAGLLTSRSTTIRYALNPELGITGPDARTLAKWDALTAAGQRVVGIGNSDAHANTVSQWGYTRVIFPYEFLFRQVNTHLLTSESLTGELAHDRDVLMRALARGNCFIGYDGIGATKGFRFTASNERGEFNMGDELPNRTGVTLQISLPAPAEVRLLCNGQEALRREAQSLTHILPPRKTGVYRVEAHLPFKGQQRGWIYSNPLYVRA